MTGHGRSHGAGTAVNAMATGRGAAFGLDFRVEAVVAPSAKDEVRSGGRPVPQGEAGLVSAAVHLVRAHADAEEPVRVDIESGIPARKGLKSSSAVALAVLQATADHFGVHTGQEHLLDWAAEAGLRSGTSRTGAYDDAAACLIGGLLFTDNTARHILARDQLPDGLVALVHVPQGETASADYRTTDLSQAAQGAERAFRLAEAGHIPDAMQVNTAAYAPVFGADVTFTDRARSLGAWAAGLSGTGPAQVALVDRARVDDFRGLGDIRIVELFRGDPE